MQPTTEPNYQNPDFSSPLLKQQFKTKQHIEGLLPCDLADQLNSFMTQYEAATDTDDRERVLLALASHLTLWAKSHMSATALQDAQKDFIANHQRISAEQRELMLWLERYFPEQASAGQALNSHLYDICKGIMMAKRTYPWYVVVFCSAGWLAFAVSMLALMSGR